MKVVKWIVIGIVLLVVAATGFVYLNINHIVKSTVESQGTEQLKVPTELDGVSLSLFKGTLDLNNLTVGSPPGFAAPHMLSLGGLSVDTGGIGNLRREPIHVASIKIDQPKLVVEQAGGKLNFKALLDNLPSNPDQNPPGPTEGKQPVKLIIDDLTVNNAQVVIRGLDQLPAGLARLVNIPAEIDIPIPSIDVKNIGNADGANNGAAIKDVLTTLIAQMVARAADSDKVPPELKGVLTGDLSAVKDKLTQAAGAELNKVTGQLNAKIPGNLGKLINQATGQQGGGQGNNPAQNLLNQGLGALKGTTTQPSK